ncbi:MAG: hypothetical protein ABI461_14545 [Polyangiaceae bacterium]
MNARIAVVLISSLSLFACALDSGPPPEELAVVSPMPAADRFAQRFAVVSIHADDAGVEADAAIDDRSGNVADPHTVLEDGGAFPLITVPR